VAVAFAILQIVKGEILMALWVSMAGAINWVSNVLEERCEDLEADTKELIQVNRDNAKVVDEIITANHDLAEALKKEQAKNAELQEEIIRLKQ
jgi:hypothetical protein